MAPSDRCNINITVAGAVDREFLVYMEPHGVVQELPQTLPKLPQGLPGLAQCPPKTWACLGRESVVLLSKTTLLHTCWI